jgi:hypothetical protein
MRAAQGHVRFAHLGLDNKDLIPDPLQKKAVAQKVPLLLPVKMRPSDEFRNEIKPSPN